MEALVLLMGMGFLSPVLPKFVQALGVEPAQLGAMVGLVITALVVLFTEFGLKYLVPCV